MASLTLHDSHQAWSWLLKLLSAITHERVGGRQMPSRGPTCCGISWNAYHICHHESNHCYPYWMCSAWDGSNNALLKARQQKCCRRWPTTQHNPAEHRGAHWQQDLRHWAASLLEQGFHHRPTGDPLHNCRQVSDSQLLTSWVNPEQESRPCHVCPRAVGMVTCRSDSRSIRDWMGVRRRLRLQDR